MEEVLAHNFKKTEPQDVLDVINGKKPLSYVPKDMFAVRQLLGMAENAGLNVILGPDKNYSFVFHEKNRNRYKAANKLVTDMLADNYGSSWSPQEWYNYHKKLGTLLGYTASEVEAFSRKQRTDREKERNKFTNFRENVNKIFEDYVTVPQATFSLEGGISQLPQQPVGFMGDSLGGATSVIITNKKKKNKNKKRIRKSKLR